MQLRGLLYLGLVLGADASRLRFRGAPGAVEKVNFARQNDASSTGVQNSPSEDVTSTSDTSSDITTSVPDDTSTSTTSAPADITTTTSSEDADTTITRTVTVTDANADTITTSTTIQKTITSTIVVTSTVFQTDTVTSTGETATSTVYETSTQWANEKRAINLAPRTVNPRGIVIVEAQATQAPEAETNEYEAEMLRARNNLEKRATVTKSVTVTVGDSSDKTVTNSVTRTVISTASSVTKTTKTVTETEQEGASTTVTVTSTLVITSTSVTTGVLSTATDTTSTDSSSSDGSSSGGLSTGAKAGIGAGAGVAALIVLGVALWCCLKRRNKPSKSELDDMFGSSEVPVGPSGGRDSTAHLSSTRMSQLSPTIPNVAPVKAPEGYRGTALGDGRAGFAKPKPYGAAYGGAPAVSPETNYSRTATTLSNPDERMDIPPTAAELGNDGHAAKWHHSNAAEIDGHQVAPRAASPQENVYEMPAQQYR